MNIKLPFSRINTREGDCCVMCQVCVSLCKTLLNCFPEWLDHSAFPPEVREGSSCSTFSSALDTVHPGSFLLLTLSLCHSRGPRLAHASCPPHAPTLSDPQSGLAQATSLWRGGSRETETLQLHWFWRPGWRWDFRCSLSTQQSSYTGAF